MACDGYFYHGRNEKEEVMKKLSAARYTLFPFLMDFFFSLWIILHCLWRRYASFLLLLFFWSSFTGRLYRLSGKKKKKRMPVELVQKTKRKWNVFNF